MTTPNRPVAAIMIQRVIAGSIDFASLWISGALGAAFGDRPSYWIGARFKLSIARAWRHSRGMHTCCLAPRVAFVLARSGQLEIEMRGLFFYILPYIIGVICIGAMIWVLTRQIG